MQRPFALGASKYLSFQRLETAHLNLDLPLLDLIQTIPLMLTFRLQLAARL
jgi:hypothetical protein